MPRGGSGTVRVVSRSPGRRRLVAVLVALTACAVIAYAVYVYVPPLVRGTGCEARAGGGTVSLMPEQADNAATVAAVAGRMDLPRRAVTVALATTLQESKLRNLPYGDRDSVGLFQQRPSQGWGKQAQLLDPVYASGQFFEALREVESYRERPVHEAAQAVQRSADGSAYARHAADARILSAVLTGEAGGGLHCWFQDSVGDLDHSDLLTEVTRELGPDVTVQLSGGGYDLPVDSDRHGWAAALWAVANASELGVASVSYSGMTWSAADGHEGWQEGDVPQGRVLIRGRQ